ncbi:MAG: U32 family peptidase [Candidatus Berkelbacteria bacterium]
MQTQSKQPNALLSVPFIFHENAINFYKSINEVQGSAKIKEVYGSLPKYTARESSRLPAITINKLGLFVDKLSTINIGFNYALNSPAITLKDLDNDIKGLLINLNKIGIKTITVSSPLAMEFIKQKFSDFNVVTSTIMGIDSIPRIEQAKWLGAKRIILDLRTNRNFGLLDKLNEVKDAEFEILVNEFCGDCLMRNCHYILQGLADNYKSSDQHFDNFPYNLCSGFFMSKTEDILKGYFVLPEWMDEYQRRGIRWFKIAGRTINDLNWHKKVITAYSTGHFSGNLLDLGQVKTTTKSEQNTKKIFIDTKKLKLCKK